MAYPRARDFIGKEYPWVRPAARECSLAVLKRMFAQAERHTESTFVLAYCFQMRRPTKGIGPSARDIEDAGSLLGRAVQFGWLIEAPGPRGGVGWKLDPKAKP